MDVLEINNVSKSFGSFKAVKNLYISLPQNVIYGFLGPNGAGKTTTIRMIMDIIMPDEGEIKVLGQRISDKIKDRIGYLPEERGLYKKMKVNEILVFLSRLKRIKQDNINKKIDYWLERFELIEWKNKKVEELSKGMQQKLQFIATIIHSPELIILDEPFAGLDPINTDLLKNIMLELKEQGTTIIFSTHMMEKVEKICDSICLINKGEKVLDGNLKKIKQQYGKNTVRIEYSGSNNFLNNKELIKSYNDYGQMVEITLNPGVDAQKLLIEAIKEATISKFEVTEPSLNDIFIEKVKEK